MRGRGCGAGACRYVGGGSAEKRDVVPIQEVCGGRERGERDVVPIQEVCGGRERGEKGHGACSRGMWGEGAGRRGRGAYSRDTGSCAGCALLTTPPSMCTSSAPAPPCPSCPAAPVCAEPAAAEMQCPSVPGAPRHKPVPGRTHAWPRIAVCMPDQAWPHARMAKHGCTHA
eukprot:366252-Chlamydomonas_euryale.AAC.10